MCSDHANVSANQRGGKTWGGGLALRRGELNKDVSRPDGEGERERGSEGGETCMESNQGSLISWR